MDDVTNYMLNVGKPLQEHTFDLRVNWNELTALKALVQNPHPNYMQNPEMTSTTMDMFEVLKELVSYSQRKTFVNRDIGH